MTTEVQKAFDFAADLVKQLITLSTGLIALTVTFQKDIFVHAQPSAACLLVASWIALMLSVICGVWALMALTGTLDPLGHNGEDMPTISIQGGNCRLPTGLQVVCFLSGIGLAIAYAVISLSSMGPE
jgi:hypothetical protein